MNYQIITGTYKGDDSIRLFARDENGRRKEIKVVGFEPYFFVPKGERAESTRITDISGTYESVYGKKLAKVTTFTPGDVPDARKKFSEHYEADIPFVRRMMIDAGISAGFEIPDNKTIIHWNNLKPCDFTHSPRFAFSDIETYAPESQGRTSSAVKDPMLMNCFYDSKKEKYLSLVQHPDGKTGTKQFAPDHTAVYLANELNLLKGCSNFMKKVQFDIYSAWYVSFDKNYQSDRGQPNNLHFPWEETNVFDILKGYKKLYPKASDKLAEVVKDEKLNIPNYEPFKTEYWQEDLDKAILVNKSHTEACVILNKKYHIIDFFWGLKNLVGFEDMTSTLWHGMLVDNMLLRRYHKKGYIVPSRPSEEERERRKAVYGNMKIGGKVITPPVGLFENQAVFDMTRYYPEMLIALNLSPEPHGDELGEAPKLCLYLIDARLKYDKLLNGYTPGTEEHDLVSLSRKTIKFATETVIGYFGAEGSRLFEPEKIYNKVTTMGQRGLGFISGVCKKDGYSLTYGDTDGLFIGIPLAKAKAYVDVLNETLKEFGKQEGIKRELSLKLDRFFSKIIFKRKKGENFGVKKRYAGRVTFEDNKDVDYLHIKGFEYVRRDASVVTKEVQHKLFDLILKEEVHEVVDYLKSIISKIENGEYSPDELAIPRTLHQNPKDYKKPSNYARGAIYSNEWFGTNIKREDRIRMLYIKKIKGYPSTDVVSVPTASVLPPETELDIPKIIEKTIKDKVEDLIELIGITWEEVYHSSKSLLSTFGGK